MALSRNQVGRRSSIPETRRIGTRRKPATTPAPQQNDQRTPSQSSNARPELELVPEPKEECPECATQDGNFCVNCGRPVQKASKLREQRVDENSRPIRRASDPPVPPPPPGNAVTHADRKKSPPPERAGSELWPRARRPGLAWPALPVLTRGIPFKGIGKG